MVVPVVSVETKEPVMFKALANPRRRDVKRLNAWVESVTDGEHVAVVFTDARHGIFRIDGPAHAGIVAGELSVGGWDLRTSKSTVPPIVRETPEQPVPLGAVVEGTTVHHGDLVTVEFEQKPYGKFRVTGLATESDYDSHVMVGAWIISSGGSQAPRVRRVQHHEGLAGEGLPVPRKRQPVKVVVPE